MFMLAVRRATIASLLLLSSLAQSEEPTRLEPGDPGELVEAEGSISGDAYVDYSITGKAGQILFVDMLASSSAAYFNVLPADDAAALFIGSSAGNVANLSLPADGDYVIRVYLVRAAGRRGESADYSLAVSLGPPDFADGLAGGPDYWQVAGLQETTPLNVRGGPAERYPSISVLRNGAVLQNRGCRLSGKERWCQIRVAGSGVSGWVIGRHLIESAPPRSPVVPGDGPRGNGTAFDATGSLSCGIAGSPMQQCPFGVIREGPGNAGVWIALGDGRERHLLFEGGAFVAADAAAAAQAERSGDGWLIQVGDERYELVDAIINGG